MGTLISARIRWIIPTEVNWDALLVKEAARIPGSVGVLVGGSAGRDKRCEQPLLCSCSIESPELSLGISLDPHSGSSSGLASNLVLEMSLSMVALFSFEMGNVATLCL